MKLNLQFPPRPEYAADHAKLIVKTAYEISSVALDYSVESLHLVDEIIEGFRRDNIKPEQIGETLFGFGCYMGEVFVRNESAEWKRADETPMKDLTNMPLLIQMPDGGIGNPIGKVLKRLENGDVDNLSYFYQVFTKKK